MKNVIIFFFLLPLCVACQDVSKSNYDTDRIVGIERVLPPEIGSVINEFYGWLFEEEWDFVFETLIDAAKANFLKEDFLAACQKYEDNWSLEELEIMKVENFNDRSIRITIRTREKTLSLVEQVNVAWWIQQDGKWKCSAPGLGEFLPLSPSYLGLPNGGIPKF